MRASEGTLRGIMGVSFSDAASVAQAIAKARRTREDEDIASALELASEAIDGGEIAEAADGALFVVVVSGRTVVARREVNDVGFYIETQPEEA